MLRLLFLASFSQFCNISIILKVVRLSHMLKKGRSLKKIAEGENIILDSEALTNFKIFLNIYRYNCNIEVT
jgi:hypothetical protein